MLTTALDRSNVGQGFADLPAGDTPLIDDPSWGQT